MGLNFLSFLHICRGALDTGAVVELRRESCCDLLLNDAESAEWQPFELKHFNDAFVLPGRGDGKKEFVFRSSGKSCFDATRPPHIISDRSSVSRALILAGWKWSLWLHFFGLLPSISPQFRWLCSVGDAAARLQRRPKVSISHHVQPHRTLLFHKDPLSTPVKYTPHHPTYLDTFPFFSHR